MLPKRSIDISQSAIQTTVHEPAASSIATNGRSATMYAEVLHKSVDELTALQHQNHHQDSCVADALSVENVNLGVNIPRPPYDGQSLDARSLQPREVKHRQGGASNSIQGVTNMQKVQAPLTGPLAPVKSAPNAKQLQRNLSR
jgi:hypothetical protein